MDEKTGNTVLGVLFILVLICLAFFFSFYFKLIPSPFKEEKQETIENYDMRIICPDNTNYMLKYKNINLVTGKMEPDSIEKISNLTKGKSYILYCWDDDNSGTDYYLALKDCINQTKCILELDKEAKIKTDYEEYRDNVDYYINVSQGILKDSIICFSWKGLYKLNTELSDANIPSRLYSFIDKCYFLGTLSEEERMVKIIYDKIDSDAEITIFILDKCYDEELKLDYGECGIEDYKEKLFI